MAGVVGCFAQYVSQGAVACSGNPAAVLLAAAGGFAWHRPGVGHELRCGWKAPQITSFGHDRDRAQQANTTERLERGNHWRLARGGGALAQGRLEPLDTFGGGGDLGQVIGKDDLVSYVLEL